MPGPNRIDSTPIRLSTHVTESRQTPDDSFGRRIANGAGTTANVVANGAAVASNFVPGGAIVSAAVSGVGGMAGAASSGQSGGMLGGGAVGSSFITGSSVPGSVSTGGVGSSSASSIPASVSSTDPSMASFSSMLNQQAASNTQYLMLQNQMQQENQVFSTLSNVLKVRHDTAKNSISNIH